jgi:hypothetical protein
VCRRWRGCGSSCPPGTHCSGSRSHGSLAAPGCTRRSRSPTAFGAADGSLRIGSSGERQRWQGIERRQRRGVGEGKASEKERQLAPFAPNAWRSRAPSAAAPDSTASSPRPTAIISNSATTCCSRGGERCKRHKRQTANARAKQGQRAGQAGARARGG